MRRISTILLTGIIAAFALLPVFGGIAPATASAAPNAKSEICAGIGGSGGGNCNVNGQPTINGTLKRIINIFSTVAGIASVIMIIIGGFRYITSGGDSGTVASAKRTVLYALIGLVVVGISQILVWFVLANIL
jgi:cytochrome bd-type quinol oxidase subunit 2